MRDVLSKSPFKILRLKYFPVERSLNLTRVVIILVPSLYGKPEEREHLKVAFNLFDRQTVLVYFRIHFIRLKFNIPSLVI